MISISARIARPVLLLCTILLCTACAAPQPPATVEKYPRKPADNPERKSGPAMLLLEAAEEDADPHKVIVIPPQEKKTDTSD